jgi:hypothetical protein
MSNEQQDLFNEAYENYSKEYEKDNSIGLLLPDGQTYIKLDRDTFMSVCKVSKIFSKKFGFIIMGVQSGKRLMTYTVAKHQ